MITYDETTTEIKVRLEDKHVGTITGSRSMGYWYKPKGGAPGKIFLTINDVKRSIEGDE